MLPRALKRRRLPALHHLMVERQRFAQGPQVVLSEPPGGGAAAPHPARVIETEANRAAGRTMMGIANRNLLQHATRYAVESRAAVSLTLTTVCLVICFYR